MTESPCATTHECVAPTAIDQDTAIALLGEVAALLRAIARVGSDPLVSELACIANGKALECLELVAND
jgi:hypothetical protein